MNKVSLDDCEDVMIDLRPFRLTCAIACARVRAHANLSAHAIVTHVKSHIQPKVLFHRILFLQSFVYVLRAPSLNNVVYVNSVSQMLITMARRLAEAEDRFCRFSFFFENRASLIAY